MKRMLRRIMAGVLLMMTGCSAASSAASYRHISQDEAIRIMEKEKDYILLDVRTQEEYAQKHIPGAICIPNETITDAPPMELPDKDQLILIYCRTGNRSKQAAQKLADMGYTNILEIGGINIWMGETVSDIEPVLMLDAHPAVDNDGILFEVTGYDSQQLTALITNKTDASFSYGEPFALYRKDGDAWLPVEWEDEPVWIMIAYDLAPQESVTVTCPLNGILNIDSGEYKLEKSSLTTEFTLVYSE